MQNMSLSNRAAYEQRSAQLERLLGRTLVVLKRIPLERWQLLISLLLMLWLSHSCARLFWLLMPAPIIPPATVAIAPINTASTNPAASVVNVAQLKSLAPFGQVVVVETIPEAQPALVEQEATDTQLNLVLRGVLGSNDEKAARAIIASGDKQDVYAIGDLLPVGNNVTLTKIFDLRVILNNNGKYESLWLFKEDPNAPRLATAYNAAPVSASGWGADSAYQTGPGEQVPGGPSPSNMPDPALTQAGKTLSDVVAMSIHREGGQVIGYKIRPGRNAELFNSLGLQTDDIVTAVNGVPLSSPGKIMEIYKSMSNATSANLEIKRGGSTVNLDVVLN